MPLHKLPPEKIEKLIALRKQGLSLRKIATRLGIHYTTCLNYLKDDYSPHEGRGQAPPEPTEKIVDRREIDGSIEMTSHDRLLSAEELMRICRADPKVWIPEYHKPNVWQGFYKLKNWLPHEKIKKIIAMAEAGRSIQQIQEEIQSPQYGHCKVNLFQSRLILRRAVPEPLEKAILEFVRKNVRPIAAPKKTKKRTGEFMVCAGLWDAHLGMYAWHSETGNDFDVKIARRRIINSVDGLIEELKPYRIERLIMPIGNDLMHFDSVRQKTAFGDHLLDTDSRFAKVYVTALECLSYLVDRSLEMCDDVDLLYCPGNHDTTSSFTLCAALAQRYRKDGRVSVDLGANPRKYITYGSVLLGFDHGAEAKKNQLALIFSTEAKEHWSKSTYREIQIGHTHQRAEQEYASVIPTNGVLIRTNPALCNVDFWHHKQGLIGEPVKSIEAWRYDRVAYRGSHVVWARDD